MPMFSVPKPRQFNYRPRFYDPRKEQLEALKRKYADHPAGASQEDVEYFERRVRELDEEEQRSKLTWKDAFRKRKMPKFEYKPRFENGELTQPSPEPVKVELSAEEHVRQFDEETTKIRRRFDFFEVFDRKHSRVWMITMGVAIICCYYLYRHRDVIADIIYKLAYNQ